MIHGTRNLAFLGVGIVLFALISTVISLTIYHNSGDIYLDRSRPGFLPEDHEQSSSEGEDYKFPGTGRLTAADLDDFSEHYQEELRALTTYEDAFSPTALSDESLGISPAI